MSDESASRSRPNLSPGAATSRRLVRTFLRFFSPPKTHQNSLKFEENNKALFPALSYQSKTFPTHTRDFITKFTGNYSPRCLGLGCIAQLRYVLLEASQLNGFQTNMSFPVLILCSLHIIFLASGPFPPNPSSNLHFVQKNLKKCEDLYPHLFPYELCCFCFSDHFREVFHQCDASRFDLFFSSVGFTTLRLIASQPQPATSRK